MIKKGPTLCVGRNGEEYSPSLPLLRPFFHLYEVLSAVAAFHNSFSEALFDGALVAIRVEVVSFELEHYFRV